MKCDSGRKVAAAETFDDLKSVTPGNTPLYEKHIRPLMSLTTEKKQQVWQKAVETAPEGIEVYRSKGCGPIRRGEVLGVSVKP
jgi:hypothetical protein